MATIQQQHAEWLSLLEISGPFLNLNTLNRVFNTGVDVIEPARANELRAAYEEWSMEAPRDQRFHRQWVLYVLQTLLGWDDTVLAEGQAIPEPFHYVAVEHGGEKVRPTFVLHQRHQPNVARAMVIVYPQDVTLEKSLPRALWAASPATRMLALLHATGVQLGIVTNGEQWMLVNASKTGMAGFISWYADLWNEERLTLRAFVSLLDAHRFFGVADEDTLGKMLDESADDAQEVTDQLGMQVRHAVEILVRALDRCDQDLRGTLLDGVTESRLYEAALTVMMRLVFLLSAEERGLFLLGDELYDQNYAISMLRAQLHDAADRTGEEVLERRSDAWSRLLATFRLVYFGSNHQDLKLPAYGGSLFDPQRFPFLEGGDTGTPPTLDNRTVLHLLDALQILQTRGEARRLSFRALDIEQIGHVYEGLLDHEARRAQEVVLAFDGSKSQQPEIPLSELELQSDILKYLKEMTGRSSTAPIKNLLNKQPDGERLRRLLEHSCRSDHALFDRVMPYLNLLRDDEFGNPLVIHPGSVFVTSGSERRSTGTHYTPRSLTEPIVEHTLEPLVYRGVAEGLPAEQWQLISPREILSLKVCDMAMGSGAFLVQVCRYLAARLIEAWERRIEAEETPIPRLTVDGETPTGALTEILIPDDPNERMTLALRLIADRCLYGVDKNPLAVEMGKLSLWLTTLAKGRPFTFLDHALKCGDSLLGVSLKQLRLWNLDTEADDVPLFRIRLGERVNEIVGLRLQLEGFTVNSVRDQQEKERLYHEAEARMNDLRTAADLLTSSYLVEGLNNAGRDDLRLRLLDVVMRGHDLTEADRKRLFPILQRHRPFHWQLEFPEVFNVARRGFDAFIGNPPFMSGLKISGNMGTSYLDYLKMTWSHAPGVADYSTYFFLVGYSNLQQTQGFLGLLATNSISQGDSRRLGLDYICSNTGTIYRADTNQTWLGSASVAVNTIHLTNSQYLGQKILNNKFVSFINPSLAEMSELTHVHVLQVNAAMSFRGSSIVGEGFILSSEEANGLLSLSPALDNVVMPHLNGIDFTSHPEQRPSQWVINFHDWSLDEASKFEECIAIVRERVKPVRDQNGRKSYRDYWWQHGEKRPELYNTIQDLNQIIGVALTSKHLAFSFLPKAMVYSQALVVIASDKSSMFGILQSNIHYYWVIYNGSTLETRLRYTSSDCFETFPFPTSEGVFALETIGETYHETRRQIMLNRQEGLTATYNRFHNPNERTDDIQYLRDLHLQMDEAVAAAYGWDDLPLEHDFHDTAQGMRYTISEAARREVLKRLLALNFERYEEEQRLGVGMDVKKGKRGKKSTAVNTPQNEGEANGDVGDPNALPPEQIPLFDDDQPKQKRLF
jgi:hypothetical protein